MTDAIVVGAGAAGLVAAWELARGGRQVTVLEAGQRPGGLVGVAELDGLRLDTGAEGYSVRGGAVADLLGDLAAADQIVKPEPGGAFVQTGHGHYPIPKGLLFGLPADPQAADVQAIVGDVPAITQSGGDTLADLTRAGYGQRVLDDLVTPLVGGVYSTAPDAVTLADLAPAAAAQLAEGAPLRQVVTDAVAAAPPGGAVHGIRGGMNRLIELLLGASDAQVRCNEPVHELTQTSTGWQVRTSARSLHAPTVVLAAPLNVVTGLLGGPPAPEATRLEVITVVLDDPELAGRTPRGTGVLVGARVPNVAAKGLTHSTAKWAWLRQTAQGREVLRLSYGRRGQPPATAGMSEADLRALVRADASALLGRPVAEPAAIHRAAWTILPPGTPRVAPIKQWLTGLRLDGLAVVGSGVAGVGLAAVVPHARETMRGMNV